MGTNYYIIKRKDYNTYMQMLETINILNFDKLKEDILNVIQKRYEDVTDILYKNDIDKMNEIFEDKIGILCSHLKYEVTPYEILGHTKIHIGKSSAGWLFCFQYQNNETCKWNNYKEVFDWLYKNTIENEDYYIIDEYNEIITYQNFKNKVDEKQKDPKNLANPENFYYCDNVGGYRFALGDFS